MKDRIGLIKARINEIVKNQELLLKSDDALEQIAKASQIIVDCIKSGGRLFTCGNGGSAADAIHIAGELIGRFQEERRAYPVIALNTDVSVLTSVSNDYGYESVFSRQIEALMKSGDVLLGISTSGNSVNVMKAFEKSKTLGGINILLSGNDGGKLKFFSDYSIIVPGQMTARIQECHICIYHIMCEMIEKDLSET